MTQDYGQDDFKGSQRFFRDLEEHMLILTFYLTI